MANISIKKDFVDGEKLFAQQLNNNFDTIEKGVNAGNKLIWKDDNGAEMQSFRGTTAEVAERPIIDGQTLYNIETGETALDYGDKRISTGAGNVVYIGDEEPQNEATKIWIENDQVLNLGSEVAISSEEPTTQEKVWIQRSRNLLDSIATTQTINGVDFTVNPDKTIKVNGTATSQIVLPITNDIVLDGTYRLSGCPIGGSASTYEIQFYGTNGTVDYGQNNAIVSNAKGIVRIVIRNGATLNNLIFKPQLEKGEVATSYEPYTPKKIHTKHDNGYEEFVNISDIENNVSDIENNVSNILNTMQLKETALKCSSLGRIDANTTTTFSLEKNWGFLFLYNDWGNGGIYAYDMRTANGNIMHIYTIRENSMATVAGESGTRNVKFTTGQVSFYAYNIYF